MTTTIENPFLQAKTPGYWPGVGVELRSVQCSTWLA
jgi:hypothetical protein